MHLCHVPKKPKLEVMNSHCLLTVQYYTVTGPGREVPGQRRHSAPGHKIDNSGSMASTSDIPATSHFSILFTDLLLEIVSYCNLEALLHLRASARLWAVLVAEHEQSRPSFTTVVGALPKLASQVKLHCSATPSVGFLFSANGSGPAKLTEALSALPSSCQVIGGGSPYPFTGHGKVFTQAGGRDGDAVLSLLSLFEAHAHVFMVNNGDLDAAEKLLTGGRSVVRENILGLVPTIDYKMFIIIPGQCAEHVEFLLQALQEGHPRAAIIGGVFSRNVFCWKDGMFQTPGGAAKNKGIVGMALWGNVPLQAVVSRGVVPRCPALKVADWKYDRNVEAISVKSVYQPASRAAAASSAATATITENPYTIFQEMGVDNMYVGLQIESPSLESGAAGVGDGGGGGETRITAHAPYELPSFEFALSQEGDIELLLSFANASQLPPANAQLAIRFFELTRLAAQAHVQSKLRAVAAELGQNKEKVLGALLFSCNGRGPRRFMDTAHSNFDALMFMSHFPDTPLSGIYAMGEIGPQATYVDDDEEGMEERGVAVASDKEEVEQRGSILRNSQSGSCALQGFTAVFALLVTPQRSTASSPLLMVLNTEGLAVAVQRVLEHRGIGGFGGKGSGAVKSGGGGGNVNGTPGAVQKA
ncbi:genome sequencing contig c308 [Nannochloropsis oceanica]